MNYIGLSTCDTANGPGVRVSLFCSGCTLHCPGCFNEESWDFKAGKPFTDETLQTLLKALEEDFVDGLSLLGGDPLEPENQDEILRIVRAVREKFGTAKTIWLWTDAATKRWRTARCSNMWTFWWTAPTSKSSRCTRRAAGSEAPISASSRSIPQRLLEGVPAAVGRVSQACTGMKFLINTVLIKDFRSKL